MELPVGGRFEFAVDLAQQGREGQSAQPGLAGGPGELHGPARLGHGTRIGVVERVGQLVEEQTPLPVGQFPVLQQDLQFGDGLRVGRRVGAHAPGRRLGPGRVGGGQQVGPALLAGHCHGLLLCLAGGYHGAHPDPAVHQLAQQRHAQQSGVLVREGRRMVGQESEGRVQEVLGVLRRVAAYGLFACEPGVVDGGRRVGGHDRGRPQQVVSGGGDVVGAEGDQAPAEPGMHPGQPQPREVGFQGVPYEGVAEADRAGTRLGEQSGGDTGLQGVEELIGIAVRGMDQERDRCLAARHGGQAQSGRHGRREQGQPSPQDVLDPLRDAGQRLLFALAGQEQGTLTQVEGVAPGPFGQDRRRPVGHAGRDAAQQCLRLGVREPAEGQSHRRAGGQACQCLGQIPLACAVRADQQQRYVAQLLGAEQEQLDAFPVAPVQVVQDDRQRLPQGCVPEPAEQGPVQAEALCRAAVRPSRGVRRAGGQERGELVGVRSRWGGACEIREHVEPGPAGRGALGLRALPRADQPALSGQLAQGGVQEAGLADAGLTGDQDHLGPAGVRPVRRGGEQGQFSVAAQEPVGREHRGRDRRPGPGGRGRMRHRLRGGGRLRAYGGRGRCRGRPVEQVECPCR